MTTQLLLATQIVLFFLAILTGVDYAMHRDARRRDAFLMFASLGGSILIGWFTNLSGQRILAVSTISGLLIIAQPWLLLRVAGHYCTIARWTHIVALAGMAASSTVILVAAAIVATGAPQPMSLAIALPILGYFVIVEAYAGFALGRGAVQSTGEQRRRLTYGAAGSACLAAVLLAAGLFALVPALVSIGTTVIGLLAAAAAICYYFAFAPPNWIRESWQQLHLAAQVAPLIAATAVVTALVTGVTIATQLDRSSFMQAERAQLTLARTTADTADEHLGAAIAAVTATASTSAVRAAVDAEPWNMTVLTEALDGLERQVKTASSAFLLDASGRSVSTGRSFADRDYYQGVVATRGPYLSNPFLTTGASPRPTFAISAPVLGPEGQLRAVVAVVFDLRLLAERLSPPEGTGSTRLALVARSGVVAAHSDPSRELTPIEGESPWAASAGRSGTSVERPPDGGPERLVAYAPTDTDGWGVFVSSPTSEIYDPIAAATTRAAAIAMGLTILLAAAGVAIASRLFNPLRTLTLATSRLATGDYEVRVPVGGAVDLRAVASEFNAMAQSLAANERQIAEHTAKLEEEVKERTAAVAALQEANRELEAFSYTVSHDLRAPLRAMNGFSRILIDDYGPQIPPEAQRFLGLVQSNAQQMGRLVDDLLGFSRLSRQALTRAWIDPRPLVLGIIGDLERDVEGRQVEFSVRSLQRCYADSSLLRQVYVNLLGNAVKYSRSREVAHIEVLMEEVDGQAVYVVRDDGVGFDMRYAKNIFGVFHRMHRAEDYEGTGVGLAIVQRVVHRHGGRIWADAEVGVGATFRFTLGNAVDDDHVEGDTVGSASGGNTNGRDTNGVAPTTQRRERAAASVSAG